MEKTIEELENESLDANLDVGGFVRNTLVFFNHPSDEFCRENCPSEAYQTLLTYREENRFLIKGTENGQRLYWKKVDGQRFRHGCYDCNERSKMQSKSD